MKYENTAPAIFLSRLNRFTAEIELEGIRKRCHVMNTGRCAELFVPGADISVRISGGVKRVTDCDLIAVKKGARWVNVDSTAPNRVFSEWVKAGTETLPESLRGLTLLRPEVRRGASRLDFYLEAAAGPAFAEIKGVTLEENGVALFPDAPTERGIKHLRELMSCAGEGYGAYAVFVIQMKGTTRMEPNMRTHPEFGRAMREAEDAGVRLLALDCIVTADSISCDEVKPVALPG